MIEAGIVRFKIQIGMVLGEIRRLYGWRSRKILQLETVEYLHKLSSHCFETRIKFNVLFSQTEVPCKHTRN
jgi:hypothetical protein